jgi:tetratricopeptide (TPR) repeat protein
LTFVRCEGNVLCSLGNAYDDLGDVRKAIGYLEQALEIAREIGDRRGEGNHLANMGQAYKRLGDVARARELWEEALRIFEEIEDPRAEWVRRWLGELEKG